MNVEIRYFSQTGNTKKMADTIAAVAGVTAKTVFEPLSPESVDIMFLGSALYAFDIAPELKTFIQTLDPKNIEKVVVFSSAAMFSSAYKQTKRALENQGLTVAPEEFHCHGEFKFARKGHPNHQDLAELAAFAKQVLAE